MTLAVQLSGLQAAQTDLDTISNNIANVGTNGFKATSANFGDVYGASLGGVGGASGTPGLGVTTTSLTQLFTEGSISQTGNPLDVAISGAGFFQLQTSGGVVYSRDGSLGVNANGYLTNNSGGIVMGYGPPAAGSTATAAGALAPLQIDQSNIPAAATTTLTLNVNLPVGDPPINTTANPFSVTNPQSYNEATTTTVYDSLGAPNTLTTFFTKVSGGAAPQPWDTHWSLTSAGGAVIASGSGATLTFSSSGALVSGSGTISVSSLPDGAAALNIAQGFTGSTLSDLNFGVTAINSDGNTAGQFVGAQISSSGQIIAQYSNGASKNMGTIALANFANPSGLTPVSGNGWLATQASGPALLNAPGSNGLGLLQSGAIEGSNVDLSTELVNLIVAQQAYQANVQGINVDQQNIQRLLTVQ